MIHFQAGTDTYGRVKTVAGTSIVTKFAMLHFLPIFPIQSFFFIGHGSTIRSGVPFIASIHTTSIVGIPLASIDVASVFMTYLRGMFGTLAIVGCIVIVPGIMSLSGDHLDDLAMVMTKGLLASLGTGILGGSLTYAVPLTSRRERDIRRYCAELLGISADPARVTPECRRLIGEWVDDPERMKNDSRIRTIRQLIALRLELADSGTSQGLESRIADLLEQLRAGEQIGE